MEMTTISVTPIDVIKVCKYASVSIHSFSLNATSCKVTVYLMDENQHVVDARNVDINEAEYALWGNDDNYIINLALSKAGVSKSQ